MKSISQYINESQDQVIDKKHISITWEDYCKKIAKQWSSFPQELREKMEDADLGRYLRVNRRMKRDWKSNEYLHEKIKFNCIIYSYS